MYKKIKTFSKEIGVPIDEFTDHLKDLKILKKNGEPRKEFVNQGLFDENGHIKHEKDFEQIVSDKQDEMLQSSIGGKYE